jgi:hypothetical protein
MRNADLEGIMPIGWLDDLGERASAYKSERDTIGSERFVRAFVYKHSIELFAFCDSHSRGCKNDGRQWIYDGGFPNGPSRQYVPKIHGA